MTTLGDNGEWALLHNLRQRFKADEIYTYAFASFFAAAAAAAIAFIPTCLAGRNVGDILISTNPFKDLTDLYSDRTRLLCVLP